MWRPAVRIALGGVLSMPVGAWPADAQFGVSIVLRPSPTCAAQSLMVSNIASVIVRCSEPRSISMRSRNGLVLMFANARNLRIQVPMAPNAERQGGADVEGASSLVEHSTAEGPSDVFDLQVVF